MRTTVNTTKRTTYVVTDHDIIEALAALGIPRSVLLSEDTTFKACENVRYEEGFDFCGAGDVTTTPFLTVEAPAEESEESEESEASVDSTPEPVKEDVYPNGTVLIGQYTGVEYTILGHDRVTDMYTMRMDGERKTFQSPRAETHNGCIYRVKPAPAPKPGHFPVGTILRMNSNGKDYFIVGHVSPPEEYAEGYHLWCINDTRKEWETYPVAHDPEAYTVVHRPTPGLPTPGEGAPTDPFPVGTVLRHNLGGFVSCITGYGPNDWYTTCTDQWGTGCDVDRVLRSARYTVLYRPPSKA